MSESKLPLYACGYPFSEIVGDNIEEIIKRIDKKKAAAILIDGQMGEGKTTLAIEVAEFVAKLRNKKVMLIKAGEVGFYDTYDVDTDKQLAMGGEDFQEKMQMCIDAKLPVCIYDEAGDFSKRGSITQFNQRLNRLFQTFRTFQILVILCLPCFDILDKQFFVEGVPRVLLNCHNRSAKQGEIRGYALEEMFYLKHYMGKEVVPMRAYQKVTPNFRGHFLDLPIQKSKKLDEISTTTKKEVLSTNILKNRGLVSYYDMAKRLNKNPDTIRILISKLGLQPTTKFKQRNYFEEGVMLMVQQHLENKEK